MHATLTKQKVLKQVHASAMPRMLSHPNNVHFFNFAHMSVMHEPRCQVSEKILSGIEPECLGIRQVKAGTDIVLYDPREDRILGEVHEGTAGLAVQKHEVVKVGHTATLPVCPPSFAILPLLQLQV